MKPPKIFCAWGATRSRDIDLPLPHVIAQLKPVLGTGTLPTGVSTPTKWSRNVSICLKNLQIIFGAWGFNRSWDIDLPSPKCNCLTLPSCWALVLYLQVCQHLLSGLQMFLCVSDTSKENLVYGALIENQILTSPFPIYLLTLAQFFGHWLSASTCVNTSQVV